MRVNYTNILKGFRLASDILRTPTPKKIKKVTFSITNMCNCRCMMCNIWKTYRKNKELRKREMKLEEIKKIFSNSAVLRDVDKISLTGGEPFLRDDFTDIFLFLYNKYPKSIFDITSNGQNPALIRKNMEKIISEIDTSRLNFLVSMDGLKNTHDKIRGKIGAFDELEETLELIKNLSSSIKLIISHTIGPWNYPELIDVYDYAHSRKIEMTMRFAEMNNSIYYNVKNHPNGWKAEELLEVESLIAKVIAKVQKKRNLLGNIISADIYFFSKMVGYISRPRRIQNCYSGTHSFFMDPHGMVYPCISLDKCMGCARDKGFDSIWQSRRALEIRKSIADRKCHCWTDCEAFLSIQRQSQFIAFNLKELIRNRSHPRSGKADDYEICFRISCCNRKRAGVGRFISSWAGIAISDA